MHKFYKRLRHSFLFLIIVQCILVNVCYSATIQVPYLLEILDDLKVADDCQNPQYARKDWRHWIDEDGNGLDTRQEVFFFASLISPVLSNDGKRVIAGRWYDPYTDNIFTQTGNLDIDHFIPLGEAHKSGGCHWSSFKKRRYANALMHKEELIAVSKNANRAKGQQDPSKWLPQNEDYHCEYVSTWILIKDRWSLWIDKEEKSAIKKVIETKCMKSSVDKQPL